MTCVSGKHPTVISLLWGVIPEVYVSRTLLEANSDFWQIGHLN